MRLVLCKCHTEAEEKAEEVSKAHACGQTDHVAGPVKGAASYACGRGSFC